MRLDDEFFDCIEEFEAGASEPYFPADWRRVSDDRFCRHCGALLPDDWEYDECAECKWWPEMLCPTLAAENPEYQRYRRSLDPVPDSDDDEVLPPEQLDLFESELLK